VCVYVYVRACVYGYLCHLSVDRADTSHCCLLTSFVSSCHFSLVPVDRCQLILAAVSCFCF
jgi:hypothetical protein